MRLPLPATLGSLVKSSTSLSLRFDRGYDGYDDNDSQWQHRSAHGDSDDGKTSFLRVFAESFNEVTKEKKQAYDEFLERRRASLEPLEPFHRKSTAPLLAGIGRWNPVEVGFTFDRLTGSPFLPGSSVKGLLRAAAQLIASGELDGEAAFWNGDTRRRIFGEGADEGGSVRSTFVFHDAFPVRWPKLEVDVMTPHHSEYYGAPAESAVAAADWDEPVPVHFLRLAAGIDFGFWIGPRKGAFDGGDRKAMATLLTTALDWLGIGAKTSSGYGWFDAPEVSPSAVIAAEIVWKNARLEWKPQDGSLLVTHGSERTQTKSKAIIDSLPAEVMTRLKDKKKTVDATVGVRKTGNFFEVIYLTVSKNP